MFSTDFFKETIVAQIILVVLFLAVLWFFDWSWESVVQPAIGTNTATVLLHLQNQDRTFEGEVTSEMSVLDAVYAAMEAGNMPVQYRFSDMGNLSLYRVGPYSVSTHTFTILVNGGEVLAQEVAHRRVQDGDLIELRIQ